MRNKANGSRRTRDVAMQLGRSCGVLLVMLGGLWAAPLAQDAPGGQDGTTGTAKKTANKSTDNKTTKTSGKKKTAKGDGGKTSAPGKADIVDFRAQPARIHSGETTSLLWQTENTDGVRIEPGVGKQDVRGKADVHPEHTTTYTLTTIGAGQAATQKTTVTVEEAETLTDANAGDNPGVASHEFGLPTFGAAPEPKNSNWIIFAAAILFLGAGLAFQAMAFGKVRTSDVDAPASLALLHAPLNQLQNQAAKARLAYDRAMEAGTRTVPPAPAPAPVLPRPADVRPMQAPDTVSPTPPPPPPPSSAYAGVLTEYEKVRTATDRGTAIATFDAKYHPARISCVNVTDLRVNSNVVLRFQEEPRGFQLLLKQGGELLAFPWFAIDLGYERERLEGIFRYPATTGGVLRVAAPAILEPRGAEYVLVKPGVLESNG